MCALPSRSIGCLMNGKRWTSEKRKKKKKDEMYITLHYHAVEELGILPAISADAVDEELRAL